MLEIILLICAVIVVVWFLAMVLILNEVCKVMRQIEEERGE